MSKCGGRQQAPRAAVEYCFNQEAGYFSNKFVHGCAAPPLTARTTSKFSQCPSGLALNTRSFEMALSSRPQPVPPPLEMDNKSNYMVGPGHTLSVSHLQETAPATPMKSAAPVAHEEDLDAPQQRTATGPKRVTTLGSASKGEVPFSAPRKNQGVLWR